MYINFKTRYVLVFQGWDIGLRGKHPERDYYLSLILVAAMVLIFQLIRVLFIKYSDVDKSRFKESFLFLLDIIGSVITMFLLMTGNFGVILTTVLSGTLAMVCYLPIYREVHYLRKNKEPVYMHL